MEEKKVFVYGGVWERCMNNGDLQLKPFQTSPQRLFSLKALERTSTEPLQLFDNPVKSNNQILQDQELKTPNSRKNLQF